MALNDSPSLEWVNCHHISVTINSICSFFCMKKLHIYIYVAMPIIPVVTYKVG